MSNEMSGRCFCGKITWRTNDPVLWSGHCHCESCRRATSAPFTSFFGVSRSGLKWTGRCAEHKTSDGDVVRKFCADCGSQMAFEFTGWPDETHLYAATLDDPSQFSAQAHFHFAEKLPWLKIDDGLPKYPGSSETTDPIVSS